MKSGFILKFTALLLFLSSALLAYERPPSISIELWQELEPYFLPESHPIKAKLDKIFKEPEVTTNSFRLKLAGFSKPKPVRVGGIVVSKHPQLKGYLVKLYTDDSPVADEWGDWLQRVRGALYVQATIERHGYEHLFKVPNKWIYPLKQNLLSILNTHKKNFILIVEDMKIYPKLHNEILWKNQMDLERLDALYTVLQEQGLIDSVYRDNVPFCKDGRQAFVDVQHFHIWPVPMHIILDSLSSEMHEHWNELCNGLKVY